MFIGLHVNDSLVIFGVGMLILVNYDPDIKTLENTYYHFQFVIFTSVHFLEVNEPASWPHNELYEFLSTCLYLFG